MIKSDWKPQDRKNKKKYRYEDVYTFNDDYEPSDADLEYLSKWKKRMKQIDEFRTTRVKEWKDNEKRTYDRIITPVDDSEHDKTTAIRQPLELAISMGKLSQLIQKPPKCLISGVEESDQKHEDTATMALEYKMREAMWGAVLPNAMLKAINDGSSFIKASWVKRYKDVRDKETGEKTGKQYTSYNGLCYEVLENQNVFIDESCEEIYTPHGVNSAKFVSIRRVIRFDEWRKTREKEKLFSNVDAVKPRSYDEEEFYVFKNDEKTKITSTGDWVIEFETYDLLEEKITVIANGVKVYEANLDERIPLVMLKNIPIPNRLYSRGDPEMLRGLIGMSNSLFNKAESQAELAINPPVVLGHGIESDDIQTGAGGIIETRSANARDAVEFIRYPDITNGIQFMLEYIKNAITYTAGFNIDSLNSKKDQTAFGLAMQQEQTLIRLGLFVKYNESKGLKDLYDISLGLMQKYFTEKEARLITLPNGELTVEDRTPVVKVKGKKAVRKEDKDGREYFEFMPGDGKYSSFEYDTQMMEGRKFDLEIIPGTMREDMLLVKAEKLARIIQTLSQNPRWMERFSDELPEFLVESMGESTERLIKKEEVQQGEGGQSEGSSLEKEWQALVGSEIPVEQIVDDTANADERINGLREKVVQEGKQLSPKQAGRVRKAMMMYIQIKQGKMGTPSVPQGGGEVMQGQPIKVPQQQAGGMEERAGKSEIRQKAQALSKGLNPMNG